MAKVEIYIYLCYFVLPCLHICWYALFGKEMTLYKCCVLFSFHKKRKKSPVSAAVNRRHPDVSPSHPQVLRVSSSKKTSSLAVQRNLSFYFLSIFLFSSHCRLLCTIRMALVLVEGPGGRSCEMFTDGLFGAFLLLFVLEALDSLSFLFLAAAVTDKNVLC